MKSFMQKQLLVCPLKFRNKKQLKFDLIAIFRYRNRVVFSFSPY